MQIVHYGDYMTINEYTKSIEQNRVNNDEKIIILPIMCTNDEKKVESNTNNNNEK